jgi:hypothetical protein
MHCAEGDAKFAPRCTIHISFIFRTASSQFVPLVRFLDGWEVHQLDNGEGGVPEGFTTYFET